MADVDKDEAVVKTPVKREVEQTEDMDTADAEASTKQETEKEKTTATSPKKSPATSPKKSPKKSPVKEAKTPAKKIKKEEPKEEEDNEEEEHDDDMPLGALDAPLVVEGKRQRHSVSRLAPPTPTVKDRSAVKGSGTPLADIPFIAAMIDKHSVVDLKDLHHVCFGGRAAAKVVKKELREFNGLPWDQDSTDAAKKKASLSKMTLAQLKEVRNMLGLHAAGTKDNEIDALIAFIIKPEDQGKRVPKPKKKKAKRASKGAAKTPKKTPSKSKSKEEVSDDDDGSESGDNDDGDESDGEEEEPVSETPAKTPAKTSAKKRKASEEAEEQKKMKKTPAKKVKVEEEDDEEKEDDENPANKTPAKKAKMEKEAKKEIKEEDKDSDDASNDSADKNASSPSDAEVDSTIMELLGTFDLEQVSMRQMCMAVCEKFPGSDLAERKTFLKDKIRAAIANLPAQ